MGLGRCGVKYRKGNLSEEENQSLLAIPGMRDRLSRWDKDALTSEELAAESGLSEAMLAALPPDAPDGHEAYKKVCWRQSQSIAVFQYKDGSGGKVNFQTTMT